MRELSVKKGVEFYKLSPETAEFYHHAAYDVAWEEDAKQWPADVVNGLKAIVKK